MKKIKDVQLNPKLIARQELNQEDILKIKKLHRQKKKLFSNIIRWMETNQADKIMGSAKKLEKIEFKMQEAWKFSQDYTLHSHWFQNPACSCPKMDNLDYIGYKIIYSSECVLHKHLVDEGKSLKIHMRSEMTDVGKGVFHLI